MMKIKNIGYRGTGKNVPDDRREMNFSDKNIDKER